MLGIMTSDDAIGEFVFNRLFVFVFECFQESGTEYSKKCSSAHPECPWCALPMNIFFCIWKESICIWIYFELDILKSAAAHPPQSQVCLAHEYFQHQFPPKPENGLHPDNPGKKAQYIQKYTNTNTNTRTDSLETSKVIYFELEGPEGSNY